MDGDVPIEAATITGTSSRASTTLTVVSLGVADCHHKRPGLVGLPACHCRHLLGCVCEHDDVDDTGVAPCRPVVGMVRPRHHLLLPAVCCKNALVGRIDGRSDEDHDAVTTGRCFGLYPFSIRLFFAISVLVVAWWTAVVTPPVWSAAWWASSSVLVSSPLGTLASLTTVLVTSQSSLSRLG